MPQYYVTSGNGYIHNAQNLEMASDITKRLLLSLTDAINIANELAIQNISAVIHMDKTSVHTKIEVNDESDNNLINIDDDSTNLENGSSAVDIFESVLDDSLLIPDTVNEDDDIF